MTAPTVNVTVRLLAQDGTPRAGVTVTATLDRDDRYNGFIVSGGVSAVTDAAGAAVLPLFPNHPTTGLGTTGSIYIFRASPPGAAPFRAAAQVPNANSFLDEIAVLPLGSALDNALERANHTGTQLAATISDFAAAVRSSVLTGLSTAAATVVDATHTVLQAIGFLQRQISDLTGTVAGKQATLVSGTNLKTVNGTTLLGAGDIATPITAPGGATTQVQYNEAGAFAGSSSFTYDSATGVLKLPPRSQVGGSTNAFPSIKRVNTGLEVRLADDSALAPLTSGFLNASAAGVPLTVNASNSNGYKVAVQDAGVVVSYLGASSTVPFRIANSAVVAQYELTANGAVHSSGLYVGWSNNVNAGLGTVDLALFRGGPGVLEQRNAANAQTSHLYNNYVNSTNYERLTSMANGSAFLIFTDQAGTGAARSLTIGTAGAVSLRFFTGNVNRLDISGAGQMLWVTDNTLDIGASGASRPRSGHFGTSVVAPAIETTPSTVAGLPAAAAANKSHRRFVTDASVVHAGNSGTVVAGGGANNVPVYSDGTNWRIG